MRSAIVPAMLMGVLVLAATARGAVLRGNGGTEPLKSQVMLADNTTTTAANPWPYSTYQLCDNAFGCCTARMGSGCTISGGWSMSITPSSPLCRGGQPLGTYNNQDGSRTDFCYIKNTTTGVLYNWRLMGGSLINNGFTVTKGANTKVCTWNGCCSYSGDYGCCNLSDNGNVCVELGKYGDCLGAPSISFGGSATCLLPEGPGKMYTYLMAEYGAAGWNDMWTATPQV